jgi:hypothetical protein
LHPNEAAKDVVRRYPWLSEERHLGDQGIAGAEEEQANAEVREWAGQHQQAGVGFGGGAAWGRGGEGHEAANRKQQECAEAKTNVGCGDGARDLTHKNRGAHCQPERDTARYFAVGDDREADGECQQKYEGNVYPQVDIHEPAYGDGRTQHRSIVGVRGQTVDS